MTQPLQNQIDRLYRRILMNVAPAKILATDDTGPIHRVQVNLNGGPEIIDQLPVMQFYGLNAHAPIGSDAAAMFIAGQRSNAVIVGTNNQKARLRNLEAGEVALYTDEGDNLKFGRQQAVALTAGNSFNATTKAATIKGTDTVTLDSPVSSVTDKLVLAHDPEGPMEATTKQYVDALGGGGSGSPGPPGPAGPPGEAATIAVGTTTTGAAGTPAAVVNVGTPSAAVFDFTIPQGIQGVAGAMGATGSPGAAASIAVGTTTTGAPGTAAIVTNSGSSAAAVFNFTIPAGVAGAQGAQGTPGTPGAPGAPGAAATIAVGTTTTGAAGSAAAVVNVGTPAAAIFNFTIPQGIQGATGNTGPQGPPGTSGAITGTSGGIPYFGSTGAMASSALLQSTAIVLGGGAGNPPATTPVWSISSNGSLSAGFANAPSPASGGGIGLNGINGGTIGIFMTGFTNAGAVNTGYPFIQMTASGGSNAAPNGAILSGQRIGDFNFQGNDGSAYGLSAQFLITANENWGTTAHGTMMQWNTTAAGSTTLGAGMSLARGLMIQPTVTGGDQGYGTVNVSVGYYLAGANIFAGLTANALVCGTGANGAPRASTYYTNNSGSTVLIGNFNAAPPTNTPLPGIQLIGANSTSAGFLADTFLGTPSFVGRAAGGTQAAPAVTPANQNLAYLTGRGWNGTAYSGDVGYVLIRASETWSATANGTKLSFVITPATTTGAATAMQIGSGTTSAAGGVTIGNPTGGDLGYGTLNVQGSVQSAGANVAGGTLVVGAAINFGGPGGACTIGGNGTFSGQTTFQGNTTCFQSMNPGANNSCSVGSSSVAWNQMNSYNWFTASDRREKTNIEDLPPCLDLVREISPKTFRWAEGDDDRTHWGFIAQEVGEAMAAADHDFGGHVVDTETGRERLGYNELIAVLWQATRELAARVAHLEAAA